MCAEELVAEVREKSGERIAVEHPPRAHRGEDGKRHQIHDRKAEAEEANEKVI